VKVLEERSVENSSEILLAFDEKGQAAVAAAVEATKRLPGVAGIRKVTIAADEHTRSGEMLDFSRVILDLAPGAIKGVLGVIVSLLGRKGGPPAKIRIKSHGTEVNAEFDGNGITVDQMSRTIADILDKLGERESAAR
jgi:hypothetical protein